MSRTDHQMSRAKNELYPALFRAIEVLHIFEPYGYQSDKYAHIEAAEQLAKALPEDLKKEFIELARNKYNNLSNYSGD